MFLYHVPLGVSEVVSYEKGEKKYENNLGEELISTKIVLTK
jgi:hypothetical protein